MSEGNRARVFSDPIFTKIDAVEKKNEVTPSRLIFTAEEPLPSQIIPINCDHDLNAIDRGIAGKHSDYYMEREGKMHKDAFEVWKAIS